MPNRSLDVAKGTTKYSKQKSRNDDGIVSYKDDCDIGSIIAFCDQSSEEEMHCNSLLSMVLSCDEIPS